MFVGEALANTSAGMPWVIWVASVELASKENFTVVPGWAAWNWVPRVVKASVSEAAASTVIVPLSSRCDAAAARGGGVDEFFLPLVDEHAVTTSSDGRPGRPRDGSASSVGLRDLDDDVGGLHRGDRTHARFETEFVGRFPAHQ